MRRTNTFAIGTISRFGNRARCRGIVYSTNQFMSGVLDAIQLTLGIDEVEGRGPVNMSPYYWHDLGPNSHHEKAASDFT